MASEKSTGDKKLIEEMTQPGSTPELFSPRRLRPGPNQMLKCRSLRHCSFWREEVWRSLLFLVTRGTMMVQ